MGRVMADAGRTREPDTCIIATIVVEVQYLMSLYLLYCLEILQGQQLLSHMLKAAFTWSRLCRAWRLLPSRRRAGTRTYFPAANVPYYY